MTSNISKDGVYRIKIAGEDLYAGTNATNQVVLEPRNDSAATQKWNITVKSNTFTVTSGSNASLKLSYDLDDPNEVSGNGSLVVSATKTATVWSLTEKKGPPDYAEIHVTYAVQDPEVVGMVLDSLYPNKVVHFQSPRDNRKNQRWLFEYVEDLPVGPQPTQTPVGSNVTDEFIPTGTYSFHNVKYGNVLDLPASVTELQVGQPQFVAGQKTDSWVLTLSSNKKFTIRNGASGDYAQPEDSYGEGDSVYSQPESYEWVIRRVKNTTDTYQVYSTKNIRLFWSFQSNQPGTNLEFARAPPKDVTSTYWKIKKQSDIPGFGGSQGVVPTPIAGATRPGDKGVQGNSLEITVPKGWTVQVTGLALPNALNSIFLKAALGALVDTFQFFNQRNAGVVPMDIKDKEEKAYNATADNGPIALGLTFYGATDPKKKDPFTLHESSTNASTLTMNKIERLGDVKNFPDYTTYTITSMEGANIRGIITVQMTNKSDPGNQQPEKPNPNETNDGYNGTCDEARPDCLDKYLSKYDCVFLVDDSGSMEGQRWTEACASLVGIANEAVQFDVDGIGLEFLNSSQRATNIKGEDEITPILAKVSASGGTPTGARLDAVLGAHIAKLDAAVGSPAYGLIKPFDLIVITDGEPTDQPLPVLERWAAHLDARKHHANAVGVQFVQIGDVATATQALLELTRGKVRSMVDTIPYTGSFTLEKLTRVLLGAIMPSIRAKQNAKLPAKKP